MARTGRPSKYNEALTSEMCARLSAGESLVKICDDPTMPSTVTVFSWLEKYPEFTNKYVRARDAQAELYANQIIDIADEVPVCEVPDPDGGVSTRIDAAGIQRNKLRVDARKWIACKLLPKRYGEKMEHTGPGGGAIQIVSTIPRPPKEETDGSV